MQANVLVRDSIDKDLLTKWQALWNVSKHAHFFNSPQWFLAYCEAYNVKEYKIVVIEKNDQYEAVLPLVFHRLFGVTMLACPGGKFLDKSSLLLQENSKHLVKPLINKLMSLGNFYLHELSSELTDIIVGIDKNVIQQQASFNAYIPLQDNPFQFLSNKQRNKITNKIKNHKDHLRYESYVGDPASLELAFAIEQKSLKKQKGKTTFNTKQDKEFFYKLLKRQPENFVVDVVFYDDVPFVYQIGFLYGKICQGVNTAYDLHYRHISPGKVLLHFMLTHLQQKHMEIFDFSRGESVIKKEFTQLSYVQTDVFYTKDRVSRYWLLFMKKVYNFILENKFFYGSYLTLKKAIFALPALKRV